jgi:hypothetical protein
MKICFLWCAGTVLLKVEVCAQCMNGSPKLSIGSVSLVAISTVTFESKILIVCVCVCVYVCVFLCVLAVQVRTYSYTHT